MAFVASYPNPWSVAEEDIVPVLQKIWNAVYGGKIGPKIDYLVEADDAVCTLVSGQCLPGKSAYIKIQGISTNF
jgi:hypothetical protein